MARLFSIDSNEASLAREVLLQHDVEEPVALTAALATMSAERAQSLAGIRRPASSLVTGGSAPSRCRK